MTEPDGEVLSLTRREGSYFYRDEQIKEPSPIISHLTVVTVFGEKGPQTSWKSNGLMATMAEGVAIFCSANPGMKEAIDGMYALILAKHGRRQ